MIGSIFNFITLLHFTPIMNIKHLLSQGNWVFAHKTIIKKYDSDTAIIIGYLCSWQEKKQDWFSITYEYIENELGIKTYTCRKVFQKLIEDGILITKREGLPCKSYYYISEEALESLFDSGVYSPVNPETTSHNENSMTRPKENSMTYINSINTINNNKNKINKNILSEEDEIKPPKSMELFPKITLKDFPRFKNIYPKFRDEGATLTAWKKLCNKSNRPTWVEMRKAILAQKETRRWKDGFIPHSTTWLNQNRWLDDPSTMNETFTKTNDNKPSNNLGYDYGAPSIIYK